MANATNVQWLLAANSGKVIHRLVQLNMATKSVYIYNYFVHANVGRIDTVLCSRVTQTTDSYTDTQIDTKLHHCFHRCKPHFYINTVCIEIHSIQYIVIGSYYNVLTQNNTLNSILILYFSLTQCDEPNQSYHAIQLFHYNS